MRAYGNGKQGQRQRRQPGERVRCTTWNTTTHKHTTRHMSTQNTQGCLIHGPFSYTHGAFGAFIPRDGCVSQGCVDAVHVSVDVEAQAVTCTKAHRQEGKTQHGTRIEQHNSKRGFGRWGMYTVMYSFFSSTCQITEKSESKSDTCDLDTANNKEATNNNSSADRC